MACNAEAHGLLWIALGLRSAVFRGSEQGFKFPTESAESRCRRPPRRTRIRWIWAGPHRRRLPGRVEERFRTTLGAGLSSERENCYSRLQRNQLRDFGKQRRAPDLRFWKHSVIQFTRRLHAALLSGLRNIPSRLFQT